MERERIVGDYVLGQRIGSGSFSVVWRAKHRPTGADVALKEILRNKLHPKVANNLLIEIKILRKISHPNIIRLYDTISTPDRIFLVLELCAGGDLAGYIERHRRLGEDVARHFMRQLGAGLQVLRMNNLIHRDLKPQNLLLSAVDGNGMLKIADFGFARPLPPQGMAETMCGSPLYMAPEILLSKKYDAKADLWSVGAILYQLVTGRPPFMGQNPYQLIRNIQRSNEIRFPEPVSKELHPDCIDLCRKLLRKDPVERLSFEEFFNHSFIADQISRHEPRGPVSVSKPRSLQDEPMPFLPDEVPQSNSAPRNAALANVMKGARPVDLLQGLAAQGSSARKELVNVNLGTSKTETNEGSSLTGPPKSAIMDSMELLEKEYVLVSMPVASMDAFPSAANGQSVGFVNHLVSKTPQKAAKPGLLAGTQGLEVTHGLDSPNINTEALQVNCATRLRVLQKCAETIADLSNEKYGDGKYLEAFSTQLVCLAVWKEALSHSSETDGEHTPCCTPTRTESGSSKLLLPFLDVHDDGSGIKALRSHSEQNFCLAIEQAKGLAPHLQSFNVGNTEMPDAFEVIFDAALAVGRSAAVDELMGNVANAAAAYAKAATLMYFLFAEATRLPVTPRLVLSHSDSQRLHSYIEALSFRQSVCAVA